MSQNSAKNVGVYVCFGLNLVLNYNVWNPVDFSEVVEGVNDSLI